MGVSVVEVLPIWLRRREMSQPKGLGLVFLWLHVAVHDAYDYILPQDMSLSVNNVESGGSY